VDPDAIERGIGRVGADWDRAVSRGTLDGSARASAASDLTAAMDLVPALLDVDLVIEAIVEDEVVKRRLFAQVADSAPATAILASNTSSISISRLAEGIPSPGRVLGLHFFNPVAVLPLVEVVRGRQTDAAAVGRAVEIAAAVGKTPVVVDDAPGFVANRILLPMINEAILCLEEGVADRDAIDAVMILGMSHPIGPLALADLIGLDVCLAILEVLHRDLGSDKYRPARTLREMVAAGHLGRKGGEGFYRYDGGRRVG